MTCLKILFSPNQSFKTPRLVEMWQALFAYLFRSAKEWPHVESCKPPTKHRPPHMLTYGTMKHKKHVSAIQENSGNPFSNISKSHGPPVVRRPAKARRTGRHEVRRLRHEHPQPDSVQVGGRTAFWILGR